MQISSNWIYVALFVQWLGPCIVVAETVVRFYDKAKSSFCHLPSLGLNYSRRTHTSFLTSHLFFFDDKTQNKIIRRDDDVHKPMTMTNTRNRRRRRRLASMNTAGDTSTTNRVLSSSQLASYQQLVAASSQLADYYWKKNYLLYSYFLRITTHKLLVSQISELFNTSLYS